MLLLRFIIIIVVIVISLTFEVDIGECKPNFPQLCQCLRLISVLGRQTI